MSYSSVTFTYDPTGNLISYDDGLTSGSYSYNALNQKLSETVTYPNFSKSFSYDYTANGLKKSFTMPDGTTYEYTYGDNNELREIRLPGTGAISYPSYTWTRPDAVLYPGGGRREYDYDPLMRITRILAKDPGKNILLDSSYSYDSMDNILSKETGQGTYNYTYDALYRLTDVQVDIPGQEHEGFSYDAVGNRLTEESVEGEWTYNENNELLTVATTEYTYDANGNARQLLLDGTVMFTYHYNTQDRLVQVDDVNGNTIAEYFYDPFGRRLWKDVGGNRTYFFYADEGLVAEYDGNGLEILTYGYRPDSTWTTDPLWLKHGGEYNFYQNDHLGTPQKLIAVNGAVVWQAKYSSFGKAQVEIETVINNLRFPGQYYDVETGWHYNWFRYYDPVIGRYTKIDPIGFAGGDENLYAYVWNAPIHLRDPWGFIPGERFSSMEEAVIDALYYAYDKTYDPYAEFRLEYGGTILKVERLKWDWENMWFTRVIQYEYDEPEEGGLTYVGIPIFPHSVCRYHAHTDYPGYDGERFSGTKFGDDDGDTDRSDRSQIPIFVITPSQRILRYDPYTEISIGEYITTLPLTKYVPPKKEGILD